VEALRERGFAVASQRATRSNAPSAVSMLPTTAP
jgi:hypothetical protein